MPIFTIISTLFHTQNLRTRLSPHMNLFLSYRITSAESSFLTLAPHRVWCNWMIFQRQSGFSHIPRLLHRALQLAPDVDCKVMLLSPFSGSLVTVMSLHNYVSIITREYQGCFCHVQMIVTIQADLPQNASAYRLTLPRILPILSLLADWGAVGCRLSRRELRCWQSV